MRDYAETRLQMATADYLRGIIRHGKQVTQTQSPFPGLLFTHPANEVSNATDAYFAALKGQEKGIFDWLFWWQEIEPVDVYIGQGLQTVRTLRAGAIEHKVADRKLSYAQEKWKLKFEEIGGVTAITRSVAETRDILISWGHECKNILCVEPSVSKEEKLRLSMEAQRPR